MTAAALLHEKRYTFCVGGRHVQERDVSFLVEIYVPLHTSKIDSGWFKREDSPARPANDGEKQRPIPGVGPNIIDSITRPQKIRDCWLESMLIPCSHKEVLL
jgi:hypothetical protein